MHRHRIAQGFLDMFARKVSVAHCIVELETERSQNRPEIASISQTAFKDPVILSQAHRILTLEVESRLASGETKRSKKRHVDIETLDSDQQLMKLLCSSKSIPEAMAKSSVALPLDGSCASGVGLVRSRTKSRPQLTAFASSAVNEVTLESITKARQRQHLAVKERLKLALDRVRQDSDALKGVLLEKFQHWAKFVRDGRYGDSQANALLYDLLEDFEKPQTRATAPCLGRQQGKPSDKFLTEADSKKEDGSIGRKRPRDGSDSDADQAPPSKKTNDDLKGSKTTIRQEVDRLNHLSIALVHSLRRFRFVCNARKCLQILAFEHTTVANTSAVETDCPCQRKDPTRVQLCCECGHLVCEECLSKQKLQATCIVEQCKGRYLSTNMISSLDLQLSELADGRQANNKVRDVIALVRRWSPAEQVLLLVQYPELADDLCRAFNGAGVSFRYVTSDIQAAKTLKEFKSVQIGDPRWFQVLIMDPFQSSAAGQ